MSVTLRHDKNITSSRVKKWDFKHLQKTKWWGRNNTQTVLTGNARSPYVTSLVQLTDSLCAGCRIVQFVYQLGRRRAVKTLVDEYCQLEVDPSWNYQPVQLMQKWSDMVVLRRHVDEMRRFMHDWLQVPCKRSGMPARTALQ